MVGTFLGIEIRRGWDLAIHPFPHVHMNGYRTRGRVGRLKLQMFSTGPALFFLLFCSATDPVTDVIWAHGLSNALNFVPQGPASE
jgi:hypothetical protein